MTGAGIIQFIDETKSFWFERIYDNLIDGSC